jgi:hypothetical protein
MFQEALRLESVRLSLVLNLSFTSSSSSRITYKNVILTRFLLDIYPHGF